MWPRHLWRRRWSTQACPPPSNSTLYRRFADVLHTGCSVVSPVGTCRWCVGNNLNVDKLHWSVKMCDCFFDIRWSHVIVKATRHFWGNNTNSYVIKNNIKWLRILMKTNLVQLCNYMYSSVGPKPRTIYRIKAYDILRHKKLLKSCNHWGHNALNM